MGEGDLGAVRQAHGRIEDVEILRAFAVGLVLVEHTAWNLVPWQLATVGPLYGHFRGWSGVDLFFAISGFVIARSLLPQLAGAPTTKTYFRVALSFWVRRVWRLLPTAWLWLVVMVALALGFNRSGVFDTTAVNLEGAVAALLNIENFRLYRAIPTGHTGVTAIYWTLSLEEQFYAVLPFLVFLTRKRLPLVLAFIAGLQLFQDRTTMYANLLLNLTRSDGLALGVLLAIWSGRPSYRRYEPAWLARSPWPFVLAPLFLVLFAAVTGEAFGLGRFKMAAITLLSIGAVWVASYDRNLILPPGRLKQALCWIGARSYAIYLIHLPTFHATVEFWSRLRPDVLKPGAAHLAVLLTMGLGLTFVLADLNYRFVEVPLRRRGVRIANRILSRRRTGDAMAAEGVA